MFRHLEGLDGEIMLEKAPQVPMDHYTIQSAVRRQEGEHPFIFYIFDEFNHPEQTWTQRQEHIKQDRRIPYTDGARVIRQELLQSLDHLLSFEQEAVDLGMEGIVIRRHDQPYKYGRSTFYSGGFHRLKREETFEGVLVGIEEAQTNMNEAELNAFGLIKRSSRQGNKIGNGMAGAFIVLHKGISHRVSAGSLTHEQRVDLWQNREKYLGDTLSAYLTTKHFPHGAKNDLRHARAVSIRFDLRKAS
jgi:ATP-dependent DNA ligase